MLTRQSVGFFIYFLKLYLRDKPMFVWMLVLPVGYVATRISSLRGMPPHAFLSYESVYWGLIITMGILNGIGFGFLAMREYGFLKMYRFIAGSLVPIVIGRLLAQVVTLLLTVWMFNIATFILLQRPLIPSIVDSTVVILLTSMPLGFFFLWIPAIRTRSQVMISVINTALIPLTYLAFQWLFVHNPIDPTFGITLLKCLNPVMFVTQTEQVLFIATGTPTNVLVAWVFALALYCFIGLGCMLFMRSNSALSRT